MSRGLGLGLRTQILLALGVAFVASFPLLGVAAVQLTHRARSQDRMRQAEAMAQAMARVLDDAAGGEADRFVSLGDALVREGAVAGVELERGRLEPRLRGRRSPGRAAEARLADGRLLRLWVEPPEPDRGAPLANLLLLYVAITGGAILLLGYVVMTYLIVRPLESLTRASERLAEGRWQVDVPVRGGTEIARLGLSFHTMARQLRDERRALEERLGELERTTAELESAQDQVVRSARLASVGRLSAGVAHEIGNPLSAILGLVELVRGGGLDDEEREEFLRRIQNETERIHKIIRDLLDFARSERDEQDEQASCDLREAVADAVHLVAPQKDLRGVTIERRVAEPLPDVRGSSDRLTQVVLNLLLNAADAIDGEGAIHLGIDREPDGSHARLTVEDTGRGIAPEVLEHLFEPFVTTKPTGQGTGLGLAVCHTIVERLGGTIRASNSESGGARFEVRLPAAQPPGAESANEG